MLTRGISFGKPGCSRLACAHVASIAIRTRRPSATMRDEPISAIPPSKQGVYLVGFSVS